MAPYGSWVSSTSRWVAAVVIDIVLQQLLAEGGDDDREWLQQT